MSQNTFRVIDVAISDESSFPKSDNIYYQCTLCNKMVPSQPDDNVGCECGNIFIDIDYFRLVINDFSSIAVLERVEEE